MLNIENFNKQICQVFVNSAINCLILIVFYGHLFVATIFVLVPLSMAAPLEAIFFSVLLLTATPFPVTIFFSVSFFMVIPFAAIFFPISLSIAMIFFSLATLGSALTAVMVTDIKSKLLV